MTIREKWHQFSVDLLANANGSYYDAIFLVSTTLKEDSLYSRDSFVVTAVELPLLCTVQAAEGMEVLSLEHIRTQFQRGGFETVSLASVLERLVALGWLLDKGQRGAPGNAFFAKSDLYQKLLARWQQHEWKQTPSGLQPIYPSIEDLAFPMAKETYERKLEQISDDLQQLQLAIITAEMLCADADKQLKDYQEWLQKQMETLGSMIRLYDAWVAHKTF